MTRYYLALVLLGCIALEISNTHNRIFVKSEVYKYPAHHLRHQKYSSTETSDHNAHHNERQSSQNHYYQNHKYHHNNQLHNSYHRFVRQDKYHVSDKEQLVEDVVPDVHSGHFHELERKENEEPELPPQDGYEPNLWHILHSELSNENASGAGDYNADSNLSEEEILDDSMTLQEDDPHITEHQNRKQHKPEPTLKCPKCESNRQNVRVSEEELTQLRIEYVKRQILGKLRLKDKPKVSPMGMPKPIYEETTIQQDEQAASKDLDNYYAKTRKKFIFLEREKNECNHLSQPSVCFSFKIDDLNLESIDVNTAVLWIFKRRSKKDLMKQTIVVSEAEQGGHNSKYLPKIKPIAIQSVDVHEGWIKIDIEWPIKRWFGNRDLSHLIHISCQSCEVDSADILISTEKDYRPFIMIDTQNRRWMSRQKRSVNCTNGVTECCREKLYISFDEIGWGDWIIRPRGYDAYFCRGSCSTAASIAQSTTHHTSLMRKVISHRDTTGKKPLELIPCCTANQYSSLEIFFRDSNNTATLMKFPNMVIESCGCM